MRRIQFEPAYVLVQRPYRETSLLIEVFTRHEGRVGLVARGVRGPRSKQRALLQPFAPLLLSWRESGELGTLAAVEAAGAPQGLAGERVFHGWYLNELLLKLLQRHDPHPGLYAAYEAVLPVLAGGDDEPALRRFELALLAELGYGLDLSGDFDPQAHYRYRHEGGFELSAATAADALSGATLLALRENAMEAADAVQRRQARTLLRAVLRRLLGGRELETPLLLRALRQRTPTGNEHG